LTDRGHAQGVERFERAAALIREGDTEGLAAHANRFATAETDAAVEAAGLKQ
jgi:hypothetical protein